MIGFYQQVVERLPIAYPGRVVPLLQLMPQFFEYEIVADCDVVPFAHAAGKPAPSGTKDSYFKRQAGELKVNLENDLMVFFSFLQYESHLCIQNVLKEKL